MTGLVATATTTVRAPPPQVWRALTDPAVIEEYMLGSHVETDWQPGSPIVWTGEYQGRPYEDHGEVVEVMPDRRLVVTHFSPSSGQEDRPENHHRLVYELQVDGEATRLSLSQDGNGSAEEVEHAERTWQGMLDRLKDVVERGGSRP